jgi:hypothetical protein
MAQNLALTFSGINSSTLDPATSVMHEVYTHTFGSKHIGGCMFVTCDGAVTFVTNNIDITTYRSLGQKADGLPAGKWLP